MHCKRFARMTFRENIAKQNTTQFVANDIPENTFTAEEKKSRNNAK